MDRSPLNSNFVTYYQREVALYTSTKNGVVQGTELGVFVLPHRWTCATLKACVHDFLANQFDTRKKDIKIDSIYYKKSRKSRTVVAVNGDMDISALLDEYPLTFACGRRKTGPRAKIIMAVDWSLTKRHDGMCAADRCLFMSVYVDSLHNFSVSFSVFYNGFRFQFVTCHNYTSPFPSLGLDKIDKHGYVCTRDGSYGCFCIRSDEYQTERAQDFKVVYSTTRC